MPDIVLAVSALLCVGFLATRLARLLGIPHSVFLVLLGIAAGLLLKSYSPSLPLDLHDHFADIVVYLLLPALVFEAGFHIDARELRMDLAAIAALATVGLFISTLVVGAGLHFLLGIKEAPALLFGALISATDPVAVVALFKEVGAPRRLSTLVEGESLLNDATAIVLFRVLLAAGFSHTQPAARLLSGSWQFVAVTAGGLLVGLLVVAAASAAWRWTSESAPAQLGLSVVAAYMSFLLADHILHVSGVMATLTVSLFLGSRARLQLNREALHNLQALWEFFALAANTLVFLGVGLSAPLESMYYNAAHLPLAILLVYLARFLSVFGTLLPLQRGGWIRPLRLAYQAVLAWAGLRGGLALALVLILPDELGAKPLLLAMATAVVLCNLLINALTTGPLMKRLGLNLLLGPEEIFYRRTLLDVFHGVFATLRQASGASGLSNALVDEMETRAYQGLDLRRPQIPDEEARVTFDARRLLLYEQQYYNQQLERGILSPGAYRTLDSAVTHRLDLLREGGLEALARYEPPLQPQKRRWQKHVRAQVVHFEVMLQMELALRTVYPRISEDETIRPLVQAWIDAAAASIETLHSTHPHLSAAVQSRFVAHTVASSARQALDEMLEAEVITGTVHAHAQERVKHIHEDLIREARRRFHPTLQDFLAHIPLLAVLPRDAIVWLESSAPRTRHLAGTTLARQGEAATSMFVVFSGRVQVADGEVLQAGGYFGEGSLLLGGDWPITAVALVESEVMEITRSLWDTLCARWPQLGHATEEIKATRSSVSSEQGVHEGGGVEGT